MYCPTTPDQFLDGAAVASSDTRHDPMYAFTMGALSGRSDGGTVTVNEAELARLFVDCGGGENVRCVVEADFAVVGVTVALVLAAEPDPGPAGRLVPDPATVLPTVEAPAGPVESDTEPDEAPDAACDAAEAPDAPSDGCAVTDWPADELGGAVYVPGPTTCGAVPEFVHAPVTSSATAAVDAR